MDDGVTDAYDERFSNREHIFWRTCNQPTRHRYGRYHSQLGDLRGCRSAFQARTDAKMNLGPLAHGKVTYTTGFLRILLARETRVLANKGLMDAINRSQFEHI